MARTPHTLRTPLAFALSMLASINTARGENAPLPRDDRGTRIKQANSDGVHTSFANQSNSTTRRDTEQASLATDNAAPSAAAPNKSLPLSSKRLPAPKTESDAKPSGWSTLLNALGSLTVVLGLFAALVWFLRRTNPKSMSALPGEVFEVLGRSPLAPRQQAQLVRCGNKLLLLSVTAGGAETLTEITDPAEVERLVAICQQARPNSASTSFRNLFSQFGSEAPRERRSTSRDHRAGLGLLRQSSTEVADA